MATHLFSRGTSTADALSYLWGENRSGDSADERPAHRLLRLLYAVLATIALCIVLVQLARAGGPKYVAGISYFNQGTAGTPLTWSQGTVNYYTDQGDLSGILPGASADAFVADAFSQWTSIATAGLSVTHAGQLAEDVNGTNVYRNSNGSITMPADIMPTAVNTPVGIVYDEDGTVTDAFLGQGAGDPSACFYNAAYGGPDNFGADAHFLHALVVLNGNCAQNSSQLLDVEYRLVRVLGRVLGLDWSQANLNVLTGNPRPTQDDYAGFTIMHATDPQNCVPITLCYPNPYQPKMDDQAALSRLYPATNFSANTARIRGTLYFSTANGQAGQGMQGVNVVARWIDPATGLPSRAYVATSVSGFLFCGNAGTTVTGFNDSGGLPFNRWGSNDLTVEGFFDLAGLQIPNGGNSAQYQLTVEAVDPFWSEPVGPYGPWQVRPSGLTSPIVVNVTLGGDIQQDIVMQGSAVQKSDWFEPTTYQSPAALPAVGDWAGSLSPYDNIDYFWFSGQANRTLSVIVTALDESGAASESKAQPVVGMWALSDQGTYPAPANTPSAFNSPYFGITMLNAQLLDSTNFRIGIADIRGDGRPDYRYHARVFYGDHINPARASVAGGTPFAIQGYGFQANTQVNIASVKAPALAVAANQIVATAPAIADGVQDVALVDPPTQGGSALSGVLTYGAGPNDLLHLIAGSNPSTPVGGQAPNPILVEVVAADGVTPVPGASVFLTSSPAVAFSACSGGTSCTVLSDQTGQVSTLATVLTAGTITITAQLAPASYTNPQQVQTTLLGTESALDLALAPQYSWIAQGATISVPLTARVLSNGMPVSGRTVNFYLTKGSGTLNPATNKTDSNGYASSSLQLSSLSGDVQVAVCVEPGDAPCKTFYGTAVSPSTLHIQPVAGNIQIAAVGQNFQNVVMRVTDSSKTPNPVLGVSVMVESVIGRTDNNATIISAGDTNITRNPMPIILSSSQAYLNSDANGLVSFQPTTGAFQGALLVLGTATAGPGNLQFELQSLWPVEN